MKKSILTVVTLMLCAVVVTASAGFVYAQEEPIVPIDGIKVIDYRNINTFSEELLDEHVVLIYDDNCAIDDPTTDVVETEGRYALILYRDGIIKRGHYFTDDTGMISEAGLERAYDKCVELYGSIDWDTNIPAADQNAVVNPLPEYEETPSSQIFEAYDEFYEYTDVEGNEKFGYIMFRVILSYMKCGNSRLYFVNTVSNLVPGKAMAPLDDSYNDTTVTKTYGETIQFDYELNSGSVLTVQPAHLHDLWPKYGGYAATITSHFGLNSSIANSFELGAEVNETTGAGLTASRKVTSTFGAEYFYEVQREEEHPVFNSMIMPTGENGNVDPDTVGFSYIDFGVAEERSILLDNGVIFETEVFDNTNCTIELNFNLNWVTDHWTFLDFANGERTLSQTITCIIPIII